MSETLSKIVEVSNEFKKADEGNVESVASLFSNELAPMVVEDIKQATTILSSFVEMQCDSDEFDALTKTIAGVTEGIACQMTLGNEENPMETLKILLTMAKHRELMLDVSLSAFFLGLKIGNQLPRSIQSE